MNLLFLIILMFFHLSKGKNQCNLLGPLKRGISQNIEGSGYCIYLYNLEYEDKEEIELKVTIYNGYFTEDAIYYGKSNYTFNKRDPLYLPKEKKFNSSNYGNYLNDTYYNYFTYYFIIEKFKANYTHISLPRFVVSEKGYIEVSVYKLVEKDDSFPIWAIITIVIGGVVLLAILILVIIHFTKKNKNKNFDSNPVNDNSKPINDFTPNVNIYPETSIEYPSPELDSPSENNISPPPAIDYPDAITDYPLPMNHIG